MSIVRIKKRNGELEILDISKIQKMTAPATFGLDGTNQSELEVDAHLKFVDGMSSSDIQNTLIQTAVEKIDIDVPNWTFVASRLKLFDLYHNVGKLLNSKKGTPYGHIKDYIQYAINEGKMFPAIADGYDLDDLNNYIDSSRDYLFNYLGIKTLCDRYLIKNSAGKIIELPQHMFMAIAMFLAQDEVNKQQCAKEFYDVVSKFEVMLATPTLSNARTNRHQLSSCYIGSVPDCIEGIFDMFKEFGILSKYGGGVGQDWNQIRALGGVIDNNANAAGGVVPQLKIVNDIAIGYDQIGTRKGAIAVYLEPWHMDIYDFIDLKKNSGEERRRAHDLFPALWITDLFMERVLEDKEWTLFDPYDVKELSNSYGNEFKLKYESYEKSNTIKKQTIKAKDLWKKVLTSYFEVGSPFLCFKDTANRANPNSHVGMIHSSNLCTEIFQNTSPNEYLTRIYFNMGTMSIDFNQDDIVKLENSNKVAKKVTSLDRLSIEMFQSDMFESKEEAYKAAKVYCIENIKVDGETAVCNLASVNLSKINTIENIKRVVPIAVRMLDNVIDLNFYPSIKVKDTNLMSRSIGLGVMGEAQMLAEKQIHFGSKEHLELINIIMETISFETINTSSDLSIEKGAYPNFEGSKWNQGLMPFDQISEENWELTESKCNILNWNELREKVNKQEMRNGYLMAIAPTSSISILVGTTQAIEPVYKRKWFEENLSGLIPVVVPKLSPETWNYYTPAFEIDQLQVIKAAAIRQRWIDQGQSTNIFADPTKLSGKDLHEIYTLAWKLGLKSTYYLRSQSPEAKNDVEDRSLECSGCQ